MEIPEGNEDEPLSLAGRLRKVPKSFERYVSTTTRQYVGHVLRLVKSYWPQTPLDALGKGAKGRLYWRKIPSVSTRNLRGGRPNSGVPEQAWVSLNFGCNLFWRVSLKYSVYKCLNLCNVEYLFLWKDYVTFNLYDLAICQVVILKRYEFWRHRACSILEVDTKSCIHKCLKKQSILEESRVTWFLFRTLVLTG